MHLGITTIQRDRAPWIREWVAFHYLVGFRKFYIFLHDCADDSLKVVNDLKKRFDIVVSTVDANVERPQIECYQRSCDDFLHEVDWMAFIDGDEFLFPSKEDSMETALGDFADKKMSALGVYWKCFGSNGYHDEPAGLIIENYRMRAPDDVDANRHIKSIVRGRTSSPVRAGDNAHLFKTEHGTFDENMRPILSGITDYVPTYDRFQINHYVCQSRSYFVDFKQHSGSADGGRDNVRSEEWWLEHDRNDVRDSSVERFVEPLKELLASI